jgi:hypothetical protein
MALSYPADTIINGANPSALLTANAFREAVLGQSVFPGAKD